MPNPDKQQAEREEQRHKTTEKFFRLRWLLTALYGLLLVGDLYPVVTTGTLWRSTFPWFDFSRFIAHRGAIWTLLTILCSSMMLLGLWMNAFQYQRDQQRLAQEKLLADAGRQTEGVWPPAPQKME